MNFLKNILLTSALLFALTPIYSQARVQIIHNSADEAVAVVDVWLDQTLLLDNFAFRTASPFVDAPAGTPVTISVAAADSQNPDNPIWSNTYTFTNAEAYVMVAEGIISDSGYDPDIPFDVAVFTGAHENASMSDVTDMNIHHGSTDTPVIDIYETSVGLGQIVDNLAYAQFSGYQEIPTKDYLFKVTDETGNTVIGTYSASFQMFGFKGKAITVVASGFLNPANNSDGPAFGLWAAPAAGGDLIELPLYDPKARLQIIHNSADDALALVDIWINDNLVAEDVGFRTATPFMDVQAEQEITLSVTEPGSPTPDSPLWAGNFTFLVNQTYILVADGIISASGYNPPTPFNLEVYPGGREIANISTKTDVLFHHGSTDTPVIDIYETAPGNMQLVDNLAYPGFSGYLEMNPLDYIIEVRDESGTVKIGAYKLMLETYGLDSYAITVVASGFMQPGNNNNGPEFGLWFASALGGNLIELPEYNPVARVQFLHNSADAAAAVIDVWADDQLLIDNFAFQTASPFMEVPAGAEFTLAVTGPDSNSPDNPLWSHVYTLVVDETYIFIADGIISTSGYDPIMPFDMAVLTNAREVANQSNQTDLLIHHGSTDTPAIDIIEVGIGLGQVVNDLQYTQFAGYFGFATVNYIFQVRDANGLTKIAAYQVPLASLGLQGDAVTIVVSGFLEPENNSNGPAFGLFLAKAEGGAFLKLPEYAPKARLQIIHNSADTAAQLVDVWLNQDLIQDDFAYHTASAFMNVPADEQFTIAIKGPDSEDPYNPLYFHNYDLTEGETYIFVVDGILSISAYNPPKTFDIAVYSSAREESNISGRTDILFHHGTTDAPVVDILEIGLGAGLLVNNLDYAQYSSYLELPTIDYTLEVRDQNQVDLFGTFRTPLETYGLMNEAITVVMSGFLDPSSNSDGEPFGLWAARPQGGALLELPFFVPSARVQFIHNSGDATVSVVDVWMNETLLLDNFAFRDATAYLYIPSTVNQTIAIKQSDSQDPSNPLWSHDYNLTTDERYIMVMNGIISPSGYDPAEPFNIFQYTGAVEEASVATNTDVLVFHGSTDAPTIDLVETGGGTVADNLAYGDFDGYIEMATANYSLDLTDENGTTVLANFNAPFADLGLAGQTLTILASGFADPGSNSNGPALGLLTVQVDGTTVLLTNTIGIDDPVIDNASLSIFPNPVEDQLTITFELKSKSNTRLELSDMTGRLVQSADLGVMNAGIYNEKMSVEDLNSGIYLLNIRTGNRIVGKKVVVK